VKLNNKFVSLDELIEKDRPLSGCEKQLICIARAIVGNKKIVILDEATSNIDPQYVKL